MRMCGKGKHPRIPENRTNADKCKLCASEGRRAAAERLRQADRLARDRDRTVINLQLREGTTNDDTYTEHIRSNSILELMTRLEMALTAWERSEIQAQINALA